MGSEASCRLSVDGPAIADPSRDILESGAAAVVTGCCNFAALADGSRSEAGVLPVTASDQCESTFLT